MKKLLLSAFCLLGVASFASADVIYSEDFGSTGNKTVMDQYEGYSDELTASILDNSGWSISLPTQSCSDYAGASGNCNAYTSTTGKYFILNFGDKFDGYKNVKLSLGYFKGAGKNKANSVACYISKDGGENWSDDMLTENTGASSTWYTDEVVIPDDYMGNLAIKFANTANNTNRLDDIIISGDAAEIETCFEIVEATSVEELDWNQIANIDGAWEATVLTFGEYGMPEYINNGINIHAQAAIYDREVEPGTWQSVCIPFSIDPVELDFDWSELGYTLLSLDQEQTTDNGYLTFTVLDDDAVLEAQKPYLINSATDNEISLYAEDVTVGKAAPITLHEGNNVTMTGTLQDTDLTSTADGVHYALKDGVFRHAGDKTKTLKAYRAYVTIQGAGTANGLNIRVEDTEDNTEGIEAVEIEQMQENVFYNLKGQKVNNPTRGIYIFNGQKVAIK